MNKLQKGFIVPLLIVIVGLLVVGGSTYLYLKNNKSVQVQSVESHPLQVQSESNFSTTTQGVSIKNLSTLVNYTYADSPSKNLTDVKLSMHDIVFKSPWGKEKSYKGSKDRNSIGQYIFDSGIRMTVTVNKLSPKDEISSLDPEEQKTFSDVNKFLETKIGNDFNSFDYSKFVLGANQKKIDNATTPADKEGYSKVLDLKQSMVYGSGDYYLAGGNKKEMVYIPKDSNIPDYIDFWDDSNYRYTFIFPAKQGISKEDMDSIIKTISSL